MSAATRVSTLIGSLAGGRSYALQAPISTAAPFIVWQCIVETPTNTHEPVSTLSSTLVQVSCYATTLAAAYALRDQVVSAMEGDHAEGPILVEAKRDDFDSSATPGLYRADVDFSVWDGA